MLSSRARLLPTRDVMARLGVSRITLYRWVRTGALRAPIKHRGRNAWPLQAIDAALIRRATARAICHNVSPLAQARQRRGWTQARLAALLGIDSSSVSAWERGTRPGRKHRERVAVLLGEPVASLWPTAGGAR